MASSSSSSSGEGEPARALPLRPAWVCQRCGYAGEREHFLNGLECPRCGSDEVKYWYGLEVPPPQQGARDGEQQQQQQR